MAEIKPVMDIINTQGPQNIIIENYLGANMRSNPMPHHSSTLTINLIWCKYV